MRYGKVSKNAKGSQGVDAKISACRWACRWACSGRQTHARAQIRDCPHGRRGHESQAGSAGLTEIERRLTEWARWVTVRHPPGHCRSIEHRYLHPRWRVEQQDSTPEPSPHAPVDVLAALAVERTMRFLPVKHSKALRLSYVSRLPWADCCRRLAIRLDKWAEFVADARFMVKNRLLK